MAIFIQELSGERELPVVDLRVWLVDLTYTQQSISSETMPQAIGGLAAYANSRMRLSTPVRLFKYPEKLAAALRDAEPPDVIGFSHYIWNSQLSLAFAARIKERFPETITVFGGPHYPATRDEQERFLRDRLGPAADFYVDREGEKAFTEFLLRLAAAGDPRGVHGHVAGVHSIDDTGRAHLPELDARLPTLTDVESPYLSGLLDEFFDGCLVPTLQTNRGCPFTCSFCVEGTRYYGKVAKKRPERVRDELLYIGERMAELVGKPGVRNELIITDSNFGMFAEDLEICEAVAECRRIYGWPRYVDTTTGKNKRDRVLAAITKADGMITLSGSVQSLDPTVLHNVRRSNIDTGQLMEVALSAAERNTGSYSEVILALPGDSKASHFGTLDNLIEAGFDRLNMFQLALLPGSDLWTGDSRREFGMTTRYRTVPRCFGRYEVLGASLTAVEVDEVCVELPTMSFDDYLDCRQLNLFVSACYNDGTLGLLVKLLRSVGLRPFGWLERIHTASWGPRLARVVREYRTETAQQLWDSPERLITHARDNIDRYILGEQGNNLLYTYRVRMLTEALDDLIDVSARSAMAMCAEAAGEFDPLIADFIDEASEYHRLRTSGLLGSPSNTPLYQQARFDLDAFDHRPGPVAEFLSTEPTLRRFTRSHEQTSLIDSYLAQFGPTPAGAGRMLTKVRFGDLLRRTELVPAPAAMTH